MQDLIRDFVIETIEGLEAIDADLVQFERDPANSVLLGRMFHLLHSIKGACGFLGLGRLSTLAHAAEDLVEGFRAGHKPQPDDVTLVLATLDQIRVLVAVLGETGCEPEGNDAGLIRQIAQATRSAAEAGAPVTFGGLPSDAESRGKDSGERPAYPDDVPLMRQKVRVAVDRLDHLMSMVSELVLVRNQLIDLSRRDDAGGYKLPLQRLSHITGALQDGVMQTRMQSVGGVFARMSRLVRDMSRDLGKEIRLEFGGADTEIDRQMLDVLKDCLGHLIRNSAAHGIEEPSERRAAGKPAHGIIRLMAGHEGSSIVCEVRDDGRGLNLQAIGARALALGLVSADALGQMNEAEVARLILAPGFSTARAVTQLAGRGVGMDAVREALDKIGGFIELDNRPGQGLGIRLKLPLTLAMAGVLIIETAGQRYALPQAAVVELVRSNPEGDVRIEMLASQPTLRMRDRLIPVLDLAGILGFEATVTDSGLIVVAEFGGRMFGLSVEAIHETEEIVVKPMPSRLRQSPFFSGATILGDGRVVLILEPAGFAALLGPAAADAAEQPGAAEAEAGPASLPLLLVRAGAGVTRVVPLALVSRIEEVPLSSIETLGSRRVVGYRGGLLPVVELGEAMNRSADSLVPMLVFRHAGRSVGVLVDSIVDVVDAPLRVDAEVDVPGCCGSAILAGETVLVLDVPGLFQAGGTELAGDGERRVLLAEASEFCRAMLQPVISGAASCLEVARSAEEARATLARQRFDVVVIGVDTAEMLDLLEAAAGEAGLGSRFIALTARPGGR
ncbi:MAG TPA: chemotaxis protein CheA, partial [Beijerinckiaceae bacterium]|nr:chemotaxis protein CheA [Beijerinckiaceae bacterium]